MRYEELMIEMTDAFFRAAEKQECDVKDLLCALRLIFGLLVDGVSKHNTKNMKFKFAMNVSELFIAVMSDMHDKFEGIDVTNLLLKNMVETSPTMH